MNISNVLQLRGFGYWQDNTYRSNDNSARSPIPICHGVSKTLSQSNSPIALRLQRGQHIGSQGMGCLLVDVVRDDQEAVGSRIRRVDRVCEVVLCVLDQLRRVVVVIICIKIEVGDMVTKFFQRYLASGVARRVRWSHVSWEKPDDVAHCHFEFILFFFWFVS